MEEIIRVNCIAEYKSEERPVSFIWQGKTYNIRKVLKFWYEEDYLKKDRKKCFKVMTESAEKFRIFYEEKNDEWKILV